MVDHPAGYRWSSHAGNSGARVDVLLSPHGDFLGLGDDEADRRAAYRALFERPLEALLLNVIREATHGGLPLASEDFKAGVLAPAGARVTRGKPGPRVCEPV